MEFFTYFLAPLIPAMLIARHLLRRLDARQMGISYRAYLICEQHNLSIEEWHRQKKMGDTMFNTLPPSNLREQYPETKFNTGK